MDAVREDGQPNLWRNFMPCVLRGSYPHLAEFFPRGCTVREKKNEIEPDIVPPTTISVQMLIWDALSLPALFPTELPNRESERKAVQLAAKAANFPSSIPFECSIF